MSLGQLAQAKPQPGLCEFVPPNSKWTQFLVRNDPHLIACLRAMRSAGFESLLEGARLLAIMELAAYTSKRASGDLIEFGVYRGGSAAVTALALRRYGMTRPLHLCDTFGGMPATLDWEFHREFDFSETSLQRVSTQLAKLAQGFPFHFHQGLFSHTLPGLAKSRFCFAHIDADLYESVRCACEFVYPRMSKGGFIVFDDYGASTCPGAKAAIDEFFADKIEKPTHIASCAYGICVGAASTDFHGLVTRRVLPRALFRAVRRLPLRIAARFARGAAELLTAARPSRILLGPFVHKTSQRNRQELDATTARNILVIRPDTLGDLVLFSPFLRELRRSNPTARITLTVQPQFRNVVELCPYVDEVLAFDHHGRGYLANLETQRRAFAFAKREFWKREFDLALLPRWGTDHYRSAFLAYFSGASTRVGYSENVESERQRLNRHWNSLLTRTIDDRKIRHEVQRNSDFLQAVGGSVRGENLEVWLGDQDHEVARHSLQDEGIAEQDLIVTIAPGAGHAKRIWRLGLFVQLSRLLVREFGARILIVGGTEDRDRGARLKEELGSAGIDFTGKTTMRQTAALLRHCTLTIANDGGPMHLAAAAGTAVVEISCHPAGGDPLHYNSPERFAPWCSDRVVLQPAHATSPCTTSCEWHEAHCILNITTDQVMEAVRYLLARRTANKTTVAGN